MRVVQLNPVADPLRREPEALLAAWPSLGGAAAAAAAAGLEVHVLQAFNKRARLERDGVTFHFIAGGARRAGVMAWYAGTLSPDVVHIHGFDAPRHAFALGRAVPHTPLLAQHHGGGPAAGWRRSSQRRGYRGVAGVAFTARDLAEPFIAAGMLPAQVPVFEVPESSSRFDSGDRDDARRRTGLHGEPCLLWVGRLTADKDPLTALDAFARAAPRLPDARLWLCYTDSELLPRLRLRLAVDFELASRVRLLGAVPHEHVELLLRAADFLLLTSRRESTGYAVLEALACGATPLVTDIPAFRRLTAGGRFGALVPPGDAAAMAAAIIEWAGRDRDALRHAAREHFERELSFAMLGARLRNAYETLSLDGAAPPRRLPSP